MSPTKIAKKSDKPLLGQILELIPSSLLNNVVGQHQSDKHCHKYKTYDQLTAMMFGQLNKCHTLREIAQGISISPKFLADIGLEQSPAKSTMRAMPSGTGTSSKRCIWGFWSTFRACLPSAANTK